MNQPTAIGLAAAAVLLAIGVIAWTISSNTVIAPPPIAAGIAPPDASAKPIQKTIDTSPGMTFNT